MEGCVHMHMHMPYLSGRALPVSRNALMLVQSGGS
jgi:hypothetical protein